ncbi:sulfotransferase [Aeromonas bestiarum]|uniref:Sulfotransferase n=1 Tax=Aeromonas bestiarum TaxID=105751 RepID=A0AAW7I3N1_9GAMM|nr:hypothetical protein [Aeromonas bestiarum]MDM5138392.1 sulfotransferase [Aeromonas bestiarum]
MEADLQVDRYDLFVLSLARSGTNFISRCLDSHPDINPLGYTRNEVITRHNRVDIFRGNRLSYYHLHVVNNLCYWERIKKIITRKFFLYSVRNPLDLALSYYNFCILQYHFGYRKTKPVVDDILLHRDFIIRQNTIAIGMSLEREFSYSKCIGFSSLRLERAQKTMNDISSWLNIEAHDINDISTKAESSLSIVLSYIPMNLEVKERKVQIYFSELEDGPAASGLPKHIFRKYIKLINVESINFGKVYGFIDSELLLSLGDMIFFDEYVIELCSKIKAELPGWLAGALDIVHAARNEYIDRIPKHVENEISSYYNPYIKQLSIHHPNVIEEW